MNYNHEQQQRARQPYNKLQNNLIESTEIKNEWRGDMDSWYEHQ